MSFQGHVEKGVVIFDEPVPLPDGTPVLIEPLAPQLADFWQSHSLSDLAHRQGVQLPQSVDDLLGGWPVDEMDDDFDQAFREWRQSESRPRA
jgi:hypothetical protein